MITIKAKIDCCGSAACVQICPKECIIFEEDMEGFRYPHVDIRNCVNCGLCEKVCPVINKNDTSRPIMSYAAKNKNEYVRQQSSSGGVFTLLSENCIRQGGVVFGARFDDNWEVKHSYTDNIDEISYYRGSKYLQSRIENTYSYAEGFLKQGRKVMFVGTPCQIAGLKHYLRVEYTNLLTVDFVCHGVPSPLVWRDYLRYLAKNKVIQRVNFRNKDDGWKKYRVVVDGETNIINEPFYNNLFMRGFLSDVYLRPSCYLCPAKSGRSHSDITLGDFWGIEKNLPVFDDDRGVSICLLNTDRGIDEFNSLDVDKCEVIYDQILKGNPSLEQSAKYDNKYRAMYWNKSNHVEAIGYVLKKMEPTFVYKCMKRLRRIIGR